MIWDTPLTTIATLLVTSPFWGSAVLKTIYFTATIREVRELGLRPAAPVAVATITVQAIGSGSVILQLWPLWGLIALAAFTLAATLLGHAFWKIPGGQRVHGINGFLANLGLLGGLLAIALLTHQP